MLKKRKGKESDKMSEENRLNQLELENLKLREEINEIKEKIGFGDKKKTVKRKKAPSKFNIFMKEEMAKIKKENPTILHKDCFKMAANNWKSR